MRVPLFVILNVLPPAGGGHELRPPIWAEGLLIISLFYVTPVIQLRSRFFAQRGIAAMLLLRDVAT